jgi:DdrB-like nuclease
MPRFGTSPIATGRDEGLVDIPLSDVIGATASETFATSPTPAMWNSSALEEMQQGRQQSEESIARFGVMPGVTHAPTTPLLSKKDADAKIDAAGLTGRLKVPDTGMRQAAVEMLIENKTRELRNDFILGRYQGGIAGGAVQLGTALATSLADPINIVSAFIPVVGEARYAQILGRAGTSMASRAAVRGAVGAIEGTVGAAMVEPLIYTSQQQLQADYDGYDSLMNVGFGAIFGGALQPAAGAIGDVLARRAGMGAWAENLTAAGERELPEISPAWVGGGGTRFVDGDDYVRGQFVAVEAAELRGGESLGELDIGQVGASHTADTGAPVLAPDGGVIAGDKRLGTILDAYESGRAADYRNSVAAEAGRYGLDPDAVAKMERPVLVRVESGREAGAWGEFKAVAESAPKPRVTATEAASFIDRRLSSLEEASKGAGPETRAEYAALSRELEELEGLIREQDATLAGGLQLSPEARLTADERRFIDNRRVELRSQIERARMAGGYADQLAALRSRLEKTDADSDLITLAESLGAEPFGRSVASRQQAEAAIKVGIAQAVNGTHIDMLPASQLDGTPGSVERFLEEKRVSDEAQARYVQQQDEQATEMVVDLARFDPDDVDKLEKEVADLESRVREEARATGADESEIDDALAEAAELDEALGVESKALKGISLCMMRSA